MYDIDYIMEETILMKIAVEYTATVWEILFLLTVLLVIAYIIVAPMMTTYSTFYVRHVSNEPCFDLTV